MNTTTLTLISITVLAATAFAAQLTTELPQQCTTTLHECLQVPEVTETELPSALSPTDLIQ